MCLPRVAPSHVSPGRCFWPGVSCCPLERVVSLERPWGLSCLLDRPRGPCPRCVPRGLGTPRSLSCVSREVGPKGLCGPLLPLGSVGVWGHPPGLTARVASPPSSPPAFTWRFCCSEALPSPAVPLSELVGRPVCLPSITVMPALSRVCLLGWLLSPPT